MAEATQRLQQDKLHASMSLATHTLAHRRAILAAKAGLQAQGLRVDGAVGVALAETALRLAHGFSEGDGEGAWRRRQPCPK
jgi:hypothetical protein